MNLLSAFGGGLIIIPIILFLGAVYSAYRGYKQSKSGSEKYNPNTGRYDTVGETHPYLKTGGGVFSVILFIAFIVSVIWMINEK